MSARFGVLPDRRHSANRGTAVPHPADKSIKKLVRLTGRCLGFDYCAFQSNVPGITSRVHAASGLDLPISDLWEPMQLALDKGRYVAITQANLHPEYQSAAWVAGPLQIKAAFAHVIRDKQGDAIGCLGGFYTRPRILAMEEMTDFRHFALLIEQELSLTELAHRDPLTGLNNRRSFDELLDSEWRRAMRRRESLQVAVVDIDHFKRINDQLGHDQGDQVLVQVADTMRHLSHRASDIAARIGGEEFGLVLPGCDQGSAYRLLDQLRQDIGQIELPDALNPSVSASIGFSGTPCVEASDKKIREYVKQADMALYTAKRQGRNRVVGYAA